MSDKDSLWNVLPHEPMEQLEENLWRAEGTLQGMELRRVMTLARLDDGRLVIHNGIALKEEAMAEIEAWGTPSILIVPNGFHRLDAPAYVERYPDLKVYCPRGAHKRVEQVVKVEGDYDSLAKIGSLDLEHLEGVSESEGVMIVRSDAGTTLVFNDVIFNMPHGKGLAGFIFRHITQSTGGPRVSRLGRWLVVKDSRALASNLTRLAEIPDLKRLIVSHHITIDKEPGQVLCDVAGTL